MVCDHTEVYMLHREVRLPISIAFRGVTPFHGNDRFTFYSCFCGFARLRAIRFLPFHPLLNYNGELQSLVGFLGLGTELSLAFFLAHVQYEHIKDEGFCNFPDIALRRQAIESMPKLR